jgi:dipeptidyl aminopeptidase/acylaminoacyl peptidase
MSEISAEFVARSALRFGNVALDGADIYWIEGRPQEGGRNVVVRRSVDGRIEDVTPPSANVRTRVQEYGGAAFIVRDGVIFYSEFSDQRLYRLRPGGNPEAITPDGGWRYADATIDPRRARMICVREEIRAGEAFPQTALVALSLNGNSSGGEVVAVGYDFYSTPRFSPDGSRLAWLAWRHPQMPWDGTELWVADVAPDGGIAGRRLLAGGECESVFQPDWSPDGTLHFVSDRTGWWNVYRLRDGTIEAVYPVDADCGRPQWVLGTTTYAFAGRHLVIARCDLGIWQVVTQAGQQATDVEPAEFLAANEHHIVFVGGSPDAPDGVFRIDARSGRTERLRSAGEPPDPRVISLPQSIEFPTSRGLVAHAFYYAPLHMNTAANPVVRTAGESSGRLMVVSHGGPTSAASARLNLEIQFWTTRGFAVLDVNYGGSTGFGRAYRERLAGNWGIVDVDDCVNAATHVAARHLPGSHSVIIRGRSAGGYTTLASLAFRPDVFAAGAIYYGIGDLELLAKDTHKFESRYLDRLVGPYPAAREIYRARSPIRALDRFACPLIVFQGLDDRVVPPEHARAIADAMRGNGLPVELIEFPGEGHGFRRSETIVRCLEAELAFYDRVLT